jgi:hypothetical protein
MLALASGKILIAITTFAAVRMLADTGFDTQSELLEAPRVSRRDEMMVAALLTSGGQRREPLGYVPAPSTVLVNRQPTELLREAPQLNTSTVEVINIDATLEAASQRIKAMRLQFQTEEEELSLVAEGEVARGETRDFTDPDHQLASAKKRGVFREQLAQELDEFKKTISGMSTRIEDRRTKFRVALLE